MPLSFVKMHGAGNDFVIFDARKKPLKLAPPLLKKISQRRTGIGCDQIIVIENSKKADAFMRIYNADGSEVASCGNATRCVGWLLMEEMQADQCRLETRAGLLACERNGEIIFADMGEPRLGWEEIPLSEPRDTLHLGFSLEDLSDPAAVSMGNPHMIFVVGDPDQLPIGQWGPELEHYPLFPERANVSFAQPISDSEIKLRVWERGAGETQACGTAACATLVALHKKGLAGRRAMIHLPGGSLGVEWDKKTNHVWLSGPVELSFRGELP